MHAYRHTGGQAPNVKLHHVTRLFCIAGATDIDSQGDSKVRRPAPSLFSHTLSRAPFYGGAAFYDCSSQPASQPAKLWLCGTP